jgi:uncharacterized protein (DUF305 family)
MRHPFPLFTLTIGLMLTAIAWAPATTLSTDNPATGRSTPPDALVPTGRALATATTVPGEHGDMAAPFDQQFIDMMVPHHQGAVEMARIAQDRAKHQEVKTLADDIMHSQAAEIDRMQAWRKAWFGSSETPPMSAMPLLGGMAHEGDEGMQGDVATMDMAAEIDRLRAVEEPFDRAFIDMMIPHHQSAIAAARKALAEAEQPEIRVLAEAIIAAQEREIVQMREWRERWCGRSEQALDAPMAPAPGELPRAGGGMPPLPLAALLPLGAILLGGGLALRRGRGALPYPDR